MKMSDNKDNEYDDLVRKEEILKVITDSNISLRKERDELITKVLGLTNRVGELEDELLQNTNREVNETVELSQADYDHLTKCAIDSNEQIPGEVENLSEPIMIKEEEHLGEMNEVRSPFKMEKSVVDQEQLRIVVEEKTRAQDTILIMENELKALKNELSTKGIQLADYMNRVVQIKRVARRYKDQYYQLRSKESKALSADTSLQEPTSGTAEGSAGLEGAEVVQKKNPRDLSIQTITNFESFHELRNQYGQNLLKENRNRIAVLTDQLNLHCETSSLTLDQCLQVKKSLEIWQKLDVDMNEFLKQDSASHKTITRLSSENEKLKLVIRSMRQFKEQHSKCSNILEAMVTPNPQSADVNLGPVTDNQTKAAVSSPSLIQAGETNHHFSCNSTVTTTQANGHKRPAKTLRQNLPQNKKNRCDEQTLQKKLVIQPAFEDTVEDGIIQSTSSFSFTHQREHDGFDPWKLRNN